MTKFLILIILALGCQSKKPSPSLNPSPPVLSQPERPNPLQWIDGLSQELQQFTNEVLEPFLENPGEYTVWVTPITTHGDSHDLTAYQGIWEEYFTEEVTLLALYTDYEGCRDGCPIEVSHVLETPKGLYHLYDVDSWNGMVKQEEWSIPRDQLDSYALLVYNLMERDLNRFNSPWLGDWESLSMEELNGNFVISFTANSEMWDWASPWRSRYSRDCTITITVEGEILELVEGRAVQVESWETEEL